MTIITLVLITRTLGTMLGVKATSLQLSLKILGLSLGLTTYIIN